MFAAQWGPADRAVEEALAEARAANVAGRIWERDPALWTDDAAAQNAIRHRLGWLDAPRWASEHIPDLHALAADVRGFTRVVLLGMGGSSLAPEVLATTYGGAASRPLTVLDSTDPDEVAAAAHGTDDRTLFIVASKSGETIETRSHAAYFFDRARSGDQFIAVTDPGSPLESRARAGGFRHVFLNPPDIGGRYSALSWFGLVPAVAIGLDVEPLLARAGDAAAMCLGADNAGLDLGVALGELARRGRDKVTFDAAPRFASFGTWAEQLLAESTGKDGTGLIPVEGEPLASPDVYDNDRVFVRVLEPGWAEAAGDPFVEAGHPVVTLTVDRPEDLGALFFLWEYATAVAGWRLGVNPFDEPNVSESKQITAGLIETFERDGSLPVPDSRATAADLATFVAAAAHGDYVAVQAFVPRNELTSAALTTLRAAIRDRTRVATTVGFGPRFLHSTGQLHKGGPPTGVFVQITTDHASDVAIPGSAYSFGVLQAAQAAGDFDSLRRHGRRVIRLHLDDAEKGLARLADDVRDALT